MGDPEKSRRLMSLEGRFSSVRFTNYKAFDNYSIQLRRFNILVGPNNSGKSTVLGAFRILAEGIRRARTRKPEPIGYSGRFAWGYKIALSDLPISTENVFANYDDTRAATIEFSFSDGKKLELYFPEVGLCYLICRSDKPIETPAAFKRSYPASVGFVPVLGPVEHNEPLYKAEAARQALLTHRASRNFRNIWYHFSDDFDEFRNLIRSTWPGMDIDKPIVNYGDGKPTLAMFCPEERYPREIYWAGFGFQVWCQMLTYMLRAKKDSLLIIDEPDIYLHSDLQRQLLSLLDDLGPDIIIATHSTEIITESEPGNLLIIDKKRRTASRLRDSSGVQRLFEGLGSNLNPTLTQLAKSRRGLFVEGKDFQIFSAFSRKIGNNLVATRSDFAVVSVEGFNPQKVIDYSKGIELTLGSKIIKGVIFDRDYRSDEEIKKIRDGLKGRVEFCHILIRKEIENYLFELGPLIKAISARIRDQESRTTKNIEFKEDIEDVLLRLTESMKNETWSQLLGRAADFEKRISSGIDVASISLRLMEKFDAEWALLEGRLRIVSGKKLFSMLNGFLQEECAVTLSPLFVMQHFGKNDVPIELQELIESIEKFRLLRS